MFRKTASHWKIYALTLAVLFAVIVPAFRVLRVRYERRLESRIWPAGAPEVSVISGAPGGSLSTVLLLGDSRIAQWGLPRLAHWRIVNAGVGGATTGQIRLLTPEVLAEVHPDVVVLEAGVNDLKYLGLRPEMATAIVSLATSNLVAVVNECAGQHCRVVVLETWPVGRPSPARRLVWNAAIPASLNQLNAQLRLLDSPGRGIRVINLFSEAGLDPGPQTYLDTLHFTPETYARLTPLLEKELAAMLPLPK